MKLNTNSMKHPRVQWAIEAAMWRAVEYSRFTTAGIAEAIGAGGGEVVTVIHARRHVPAFSFWKDGNNVTDQFTQFLRAQQ